MCITSTFAGQIKQSRSKDLAYFSVEYSKDTQQLTASNQDQPGRRAAQPCSYIYPIYSVVKNRRAFRIAAASLWFRRTVRALGRLEHACSRFNLRAVARGLNLEQVDASEILFESGGAERDRTVDPLLAKQVLSQLSYSPIAHQYI